MTDREGQCVRCGGCCTSPTFTVELTEDLARFYSGFGVEVVHAGGKFKARVRLGTVCRFLVDCGEGIKQCEIYEHRPEMCRVFPVATSVLPRACGYAELTADD